MVFRGEVEKAVNENRRNVCAARWRDTVRRAVAHGMNFALSYGAQSSSYHISAGKC